MGVRRSLSTILDLSMLFETDQVTQSGLILGYFHVLQQHLVDIFLLLAPSLLSDRAQSGQQAAVVRQQTETHLVAQEPVVVQVQVSERLCVCAVVQVVAEPLQKVLF